MPTSTTPAGVAASLPNTPGGLLVLQDAKGEVAGFAILAVAPSGAGGTVVLLPAAPEPTSPAVRAGGSATSRPVASTPRCAPSRATSGSLGVAAPPTRPISKVCSPCTLFAVDLPDDIVQVRDDGRSRCSSPAARPSSRRRRRRGAHRSGAERERDLLGCPSCRRCGLPSPLAAAQWTRVAAGDDRADGLLANARRAGIGAGSSRRRHPRQGQQPEGADLLEVDVAEGEVAMAQVLPSAVSPSQDLQSPDQPTPDRGGSLARLIFVDRRRGQRVHRETPATTLVEYQQPETLDGVRSATCWAPWTSTPARCWWTAWT